MKRIHSSENIGFSKRMIFRFAQSGIGKRFAKQTKLVDRLSVKLSRGWEAEIPWTPLRKPLSECKAALVTTGGIILKSQPPFDLNDPKGDCSYRIIPDDASPDETVISHLYYDHSDVRIDLEVMFPLATLHRLRDEGTIGTTAARHYSFQGGIHDPAPLVEKTAPEVAEMMLHDQVDFAILTPA